MGIQKLAKYINSNFHDWEDISLEGCPIVLDGNGLPFYLSRRADLKWKFGGQYPALRNIMESFLDALTQRNVKPICIVFDGIDPVDKLETLRKRKEGFQKTVIEGIDGEEGYGHQAILPPLITETYRKFLEDYNKKHGNLKIYSGDEEADSLGVVIANKYNCPLAGEDSDYYISGVQKGYIPYSKLTWSGDGSPVTGKVFYRDLFARSLRISPDLVIAIPAIVGNDSIANLVEETSLRRVRDNPRYRGNDTEKGIIYVKRQRTLESLEQNLQMQDGMEVVRMFRDNLRKAREMYEGVQPFDERMFRAVCSYKANDGSEFPSWMIEQYRDFKFSKNFFEILLKGVYFLRVIPDDYNQESTKIFSRPIRQEMYGILKMAGSVREVCRVKTQLLVQQIAPTNRSGLSIFQMHVVSKEVKIRTLCSVLMCDPNTLSALDPEWYIPIASVCYWAKTARIAIHDKKMKALLLCFAECYKRDETVFDPVFDVRHLHDLTQWQCAYHDAIMLNQVLALPLPYLSPAFLFDGKRASYYYQQVSVDSHLARVPREIHSLYEMLLEAVRKNM